MQRIAHLGTIFAVILLAVGCASGEEEKPEAADQGVEAATRDGEEKSSGDKPSTGKATAAVEGARCGGPDDIACGAELSCLVTPGKANEPPPYGKCINLDGAPPEENVSPVDPE